jgi:hypothetical protein
MKADVIYKANKFKYFVNTKQPAKQKADFYLGLF